jgi:hypothetical protein
MLERKGRWACKAVTETILLICLIKQRPRHCLRQHRQRQRQRQRDKDRMDTEHRTCSWSRPSNFCPANSLPSAVPTVRVLQRELLVTRY